MSFAARFCSNVFTVGLRSLTNCGNVLQTLASRNYHVMAKPISSPNIVPLSSLQATPITPKLLLPFNSLVAQVAGFKVKARLRRRCKDCYFVIRNQRHYVICPTHRRHKQMSMKKRDDKSWVLTHATQSKIRPY